MPDNNVIKFPSMKDEVETIMIKDELDHHKDSFELVDPVIEYLHDMLHEQTGDCMFEDDDYRALKILISEAVSAIYLLSQGVEHPLQEIAEDLFNDLDIEENIDYDESNEIDDKE